MIWFETLKVLHEGWQLSDNMRSWQIKAKSPVHGAYKSFDNSLFAGFTKASFQSDSTFWFRSSQPRVPRSPGVRARGLEPTRSGPCISELAIQNTILKTFHRIPVTAYVAGKNKVTILLILYNVVMKTIVTIQFDRMMLQSNTLIDTVQVGQRPLIRPWIHAQ